MEFRIGDLICPEHGATVPAAGLVPHCTSRELDDDRPCQRMMLRAVRDPDGKVVFAWPQPAECPAGHRLASAAVSVTWNGCRCTPAGGHRLWTDLACPPGAEPAAWPPLCPTWRESRRR
jgi:hypothetical protein